MGAPDRIAPPSSDVRAVKNGWGKPPTRTMSKKWKGTINFLYVATHWSEISRELERYREEVKFLDERLKSYKEYHKEDLERVRAETAECPRLQNCPANGWHTSGPT